MRTLLLCLLAVSLIVFRSEAQPIQAVAFYYTQFEGHYSFHGSVTEFDPANQTMMIDITKVKNGYNLLAKDCQSDRRLYLLAAEQDEGLIITGFVIKDQGTMSITRPSSLTDPVGRFANLFSCPVDRTPQWSCNENPAGTFQICYHYCGPRKVIVKLPQGV